MRKNINILIAEGEPFTLDSLKIILDQIGESRKWNFKLITASDCDMAMKKIGSRKSLDLALLNLYLPPCEQKNILCGEDLGLVLRKKFPKTKIIIYSANKDNYRLNNVLRSVNPEGFLINGDIDYKIFAEAIERVLIEPPFYSSSVLSLIRQHISSDFMLDTIDRILLYQISKGTKTKDLPNYVNLSKSGVERRKRHLKMVFNIIGENDKKLIQAAKDKGYV